MKESLINIGFSENEAKLYIAVLNIGEGTVDEIVKVAKVRRPTAYSVLRRMVNKGLIAEVSGKPIRFQALPPDQAFKNFIDTREQEIIRTYEQDIKRVREELPLDVEKLTKEAQILYEKHPITVDTDRDIMIVRGERNLYKILQHIRVDKSIRTISRLPIVNPKNVPTKKLLQKVRDEGINVYQLFQSEMLKIPLYARVINIYLEMGFPVRHLLSPPIKMTIWDDSFCEIVMRPNNNLEETIFVIIQNREIIATQIIAFEALWETAKPVHLGDIEKILEKEVI